LKGPNLFAGYTGGPCGVILSTDDGVTWAEADSGLPPVTFVYLLATFGESVFAGTMLGVYPYSPYVVYCSSNSGTTWTSATSGLPALGRVVAFSANGTNLFAGVVRRESTTGVGVFLWSDTGKIWVDVSAGLPPGETVLSLAVNGGSVFAGTFHGVWQRPLAEMVTSVKTGQQDVTVEFRLEQNYPNPFNSSTTIRYALPRRSRVTFSVYNTLGQLMATLVDGEEEPGHHEVKFDGSNLASGVYFYRMRAGDNVETRKLLLLR